MWPVVLLSILLLIMGTIKALDAEIKISCGQLIVQGYNSCQIQHNEHVFHYSGPTKEVVKDLLFGLITYECDHEAGYLKSELDCAACEFECPGEGDYVANFNPHQAAIQFWSGAALGICLAAVTGSFAFRYLYRTLSSCLRLHSCQKNAGRYAIDTSTTTINAGFESFVKEEVHHYSEIDLSKQSGKATIPAPKKKTLRSMFLGFLLLGTTNACDLGVEVGLDNSTTFCYNSACSSMGRNISAMAMPFTIEVGQTLCIPDNIGRRVTLQISEIVLRARYKRVYYTSDYTSFDRITAGECCEAHEDCDSTDSTCLERIRSKIPREKLENSTMHDKCLYSGVTGLPMQCVWFDRRERKGIFYSVYRRTSYVGKVNITLIPPASSSYALMVGSYDPFPLLAMFGLKITVLDVIAKVPEFLLSFENEYYYVNGSEVDKPKSNTFGDLQVSLIDESVEKYAKDPINDDCTEHHLEVCTCNCDALPSQSMMSQFLRQKSSFHRSDHFVVRENDSSVIDTYETLTEGEVPMRIESRSSEKVKYNGECDVEIFMSYGCKSCNESSFIVLRAANITTEGLIPFESNCAFHRQSIECDYEPTKLILQDGQHDCRIKLSQDREFFVNVKYQDYGHMFEPKRKSNETGHHVDYQGSFGLLVTSEKFIDVFWKALFISWIFGLVGTFFAALISSRRNSAQNHRSENLIEL